MQKSYENLNIHSLSQSHSVTQLLKFKNMSESKTTLRGRDAETGQFTTVEEARRNPRDHVVERVPKPGYGYTK
jgi:hypothetical protein